MKIISDVQSISKIQAVSGEAGSCTCSCRHQGEEAQSEGDAQLSEGGLRGSQQEGGAAEAEGEDVLCQADPGEGPHGQALVVEQVHQQQQHQG